MKTWILSSLALGISCVANSAEVEVAPMIVNGNEASISTYPYMASLFYDRRGDLGYYGNYCGASILDSWHILTAAHCVQDATYNEYTTVVLQMEQDSDFSTAQKIAAASFYYRDDYRDGATHLWANDIAIIKLKSQIQNIPANSYVRLPVAGDESNYRVSGGKFTAIGHGNTKSNVDTSTHLLQVEVDYLPVNQCQIFGAINDSHLCTQGDYSNLTGLNNGICQGDSGGPLVWFDGNVNRQVGIASFGPATCGDPTSISQGVFTEVLDYTAWIQSVIAGNEVAKYEVGGNSNGNWTNTPVGESSGGALPIWMVLLLPLLRFRRD